MRFPILVKIDFDPNKSFQTIEQLACVRRETFFIGKVDWLNHFDWQFGFQNWPIIQSCEKNSTFNMKENLFQYNRLWAWKCLSIFINLTWTHPKVYFHLINIKETLKPGKVLDSSMRLNAKNALLLIQGKALLLLIRMKIKAKCWTKIGQHFTLFAWPEKSFANNL